VDQHLGGVELKKINRDVLDRIHAARLADGVSNSTVNRSMEVIRAVLRRAVNEWDWLDRIPRVRMLPEPQRRIRWITLEEAARLIAESPAHLAAMVRFSLETGLRRANVTGLEWSQVIWRAERRGSIPTRPRPVRRLPCRWARLPLR